MTNVEITYLVVALICLVLSAFYASSEIAYINLERIKLRHLQDNGVRGADRVARIMEHPERFLSVVLTSISFTETVLVALGGLLFVSLMGEGVGTPVGIVCIAIILLLFVKVIPKTLAAQHPEGMALRYAPYIEITSRLVWPIVVVLSWIIDKISRSTGVRTLPKALISKEEIHTCIAMGEEGGAVDETSAQMLKRVVKFGDRDVQEVMIPRTDAVWVEEGATLADFQKIYAESPLLRYPVYEGNSDNVKGVLVARDVYVAMAKGSIDKTDTVTRFGREIYFVPETKLVGELFTEMRSNGFSMAVVVSEYGGTSGVVNVEQLVEEIVGEISEDIIGAEREFEIINEYAYRVEGSMRIDEANEQLGLGVPEGEYETMAGFALHLLGHLPEEGEQVIYGNLRFVVMKVKGNRIIRLMVTREAQEEDIENTSGNDK
ncbi:hemolysin family protein [Chloroflexota bacterium]